MIELKSSAEVPAASMHRERRIRIAALLVIAGLAIELVSLRWTHPTAFIVFVAGTGACAGIGVLVFLTVLLGTGPKPARAIASDDARP